MSYNRWGELQSLVPSPVSKYGYVQPVKVSRANVYDGQSLPRFLLLNGGNPSKYRDFLRQNRVGDPFAVEPGLNVRINQDQAGFSRHPEG